MLKKILSFSITVLIMLLLACNDGSGNRVKNKDSQETTASNPAVEPSGDDPAPVIQLESLEISAGNLNPKFKPEILYYEAVLAPDVSELTVTAHPLQGYTVLIHDTQLAPEGYSAVIPIIQPVTELSILVNDENRGSVTYSLRITRMEEKLVENSSFETCDNKKYPSGWTVSGTGEFITAGEFAHSGSSSGTFTTLTSTISGREILSSPVEIEQGWDMNVSAWCYIPYAEGISSERIKISLKLYYFTDAGCASPASTDYATMTKVFLKEQGKWEKIKYERNSDDIPSDAHFVRIGLRANFDSTKGGTKNSKVFFDDISLQQ